MTLALSPQTTQNITFSASPTPSISSSTTSVWSVASGISSQATSVASSTLDNFSAPPTAIIPQLSSQSILGSAFRRPPATATVRPRPALTIGEPVPIEQRQHPRRTNRLVESSRLSSVTGPPVEQCVAPPPAPPVPSLQRQADRKVNFVENLVDSAAQIVETIWTPPKHLSSAPKDAVLPLRTFIQETLRRSRTSYSTLQVALYYLIVIRPHLPGMDCDITGMSTEEVQLIRAKQCGRRMFLAALILASKYLQDRNYSARAWSKISGLNHQEINFNEKAFLHAVDWKLHISEGVFQKWTDLVLKYTSNPSPSPVSPTRTSPWSEEEERKQEWCSLVLRLSPDLLEVEQPAMASPKSTEAAWTLNLLREAPTPAPIVAPPTATAVVPAVGISPSPGPSVGSTSSARKRSCPSLAPSHSGMTPRIGSTPSSSNLSGVNSRASVGPAAGHSSGGLTPRLRGPSAGPSNSSGVTPRLRGLGGFASPVIGSCSPNLDRGGKRARCTWDSWESFDPTKGVAQSVR